MMRAGLKAFGNDKKSQIHVYGMPHAFNADYRPSYRKEAADDGMEADAGVVQEERRGLRAVPVSVPTSFLNCWSPLRDSGLRGRRLSAAGVCLSGP